jgi:hypothetical protein
LRLSCRARIAMTVEVFIDKPHVTGYRPPTYYTGWNIGGEKADRAFRQTPHMKTCGSRFLIFPWELKSSALPYGDYSRSIADLCSAPGIWVPFTSPR